MKLPSEREIPNEVLADIIDSWVLDAMESESFSDGESNVYMGLAESGWNGEDEEGYDEQDRIAIVREIRETAVEFWQRLWEQYGKLHEELVHSKYPHKE
ncbi:hypothetical protein MUP59_06810 [Candidatus Bathyarchaeota archaeon]|nr:hypothetical protein [Candidatus Bathyarchaeota archaeon]